MNIKCHDDNSLSIQLSRIRPSHPPTPDWSSRIGMIGCGVLRDSSVFELDCHLCHAGFRVSGLLVASWNVKACSRPSCLSKLACLSQFFLLNYNEYVHCRGYLLTDTSSADGITLSFCLQSNQSNKCDL
jgi:hypothetical protein